MPALRWQPDVRKGSIARRRMVLRGGPAPWGESMPSLRGNQRRLYRRHVAGTAMTEWPIELAECADGECSQRDCQCVRFARMCESYWIEATAKAVRAVEADPVDDPFAAFA